MAEQEDDSSQLSDIQNNLFKLLDLNEDEEEENTSSSNKFSNKTSGNKKNSKVRDNVSDYAGYRTSISNIDNKSMNSNQDKHIGLSPEDGEREEVDPSGCYFDPFVEKDAQLFGMDPESLFGKVSCNLHQSERFNRERPVKLPSDGVNDWAGEFKPQARKSDEYGSKNMVFLFGRVCFLGWKSDDWESK